MQVGDIIQLKRYPQNGQFKVVEVSNRKQGITEIVYHPVDRPEKHAAGWARHYDVVLSIADIEQVSKEVQEAVEAIQAFVKARPALIIKPNSPTAKLLQPLKDDLFLAMQRLYTLSGNPNPTIDARFYSERTVGLICVMR
tara:strand:- start:39 stop:458 length:420 start_codon:yes stop_codon:yes gene_type:complete